MTSQIIPENIPNPVTPSVTRQDAENGVRQIMLFVGEDPEREGLADTPSRVVRAYEEMTYGYRMDPAQILSCVFNEKCEGTIILCDIAFHSLCEHHLLGFSGTVDIGYVPNGKVVGLSKLARLVECFARRFQIQERLNHQIADALEEHLGALGVAVVVRAHHSCMGCRGVRQPGAQMVTHALLGELRDNTLLRAEFLDLIRIK